MHQINSFLRGIADFSKVSLFLRAFDLRCSSEKEFSQYYFCQLDFDTEVFWDSYLTRPELDSYAVSTLMADCMAVVIENVLAYFSSSRAILNSSF